MRFEINQFGGMAPLVDATALADKLATLAKNVRFDRGVLAPAALQLAASADYPDVDLTGTATRAVAKLFEDGTRFAFTEVAAADAFVSPVAPTDTWGRIYYMDAAGPSFSTSDQYTGGILNSGVVSYRLGIPAPTQSPSVPVGNVTATLDADSDEVDVAYAFAYVDKYGHEGALSLASRAITLAYNESFSVDVDFAGSLPARVNFTGGSRRLYRATFDGASQAWQFLADVDIGLASYTDTTPIGDEGEVIVSENWLPAPEALEDLCLVAASFAAGTLDHYLCYSELKLPHAWPTELQYPLKYAPVKLLPMNNGLLIATTGRPYWAEGSDPYSAIPQELAVNAPCLSADSVVDMGGRAMFVTEEGIVAIGGGQGQLVSSPYLDRAGMLDLVDASCTAFAHEGRYVFSTKDDRWMAFAEDEGLVEHDFGTPPSGLSSVTYSLRDNRHFFAFSDGTVRAVDFAGQASNVEWRSKHWRTPPVGFSCVRVDADAYPVAVTIRSRYPGRDWVTMPEIQVAGPQIERLPPDVGMLWEVGVKPPQDGRVHRVVLAQSGEEAL